jgi:hypothetical protein
MITKFKIFENKEIKPNVNSVSPEFWKMVKIADWKSVIKGYHEHPTIDQTHRDFFKNAQARIYTKYDFYQIKQFDAECYLIYQQLYDYFKPIWLDDKYNDYMPSDDGYSDLISSIIGLGKTFTNSCVNDTNKFLKMAKDDYYVENFTYLFEIDENEYAEIRSDSDPLWGAARKI